MASPNHLTLEQKYGFVQLAGEDDSAFAEGCRAFRISRPTGSKWLGRYDQADSLGWRNNPAVRTIHRTRPRRSGWNDCAWRVVSPAGPVAKLAARLQRRAPRMKPRV